MFNWLRRLAFKFKRRPLVQPVDDKIAECMAWIEKHPEGTHYVACRLLETLDFMQRQFPNAHVTSIGRLAVGWSTNEPTAYLCCTSTLARGPLAIQLRGRLRAVNTDNHVLLFLR